LRSRIILVIAAVGCQRQPARSKSDPNGRPSLDAAAVTVDSTPEDARVIPDLRVDRDGLSTAVWVLKTKHGDIHVRFYPEDAPKTVARIIELVQSRFYDKLIFHRQVPCFVVQGGDPSGDGTGGTGRRLPGEFNSRRHVVGTVAMARAREPNSADSQFYISEGIHPHLDGNYTVFGQVVDGMHAAFNLQPGDVILESFLVNSTRTWTRICEDCETACSARYRDVRSCCAK
jgi:peptidylprolyl isomerase